jgi:outer membrane protein assembly factor BamB
LPAEKRVLWQRTLAGPGLGGIAAASDYVVFGDRDLDNFCDVFRCLDAATGDTVWTVQYPALGELDYGNTPRATPLIHGGYVYLFGAFGDLHCVRLDTGQIVWMKNLRLEYGLVNELIWGTCSSPLIADGKLIVNPGAPQASLLALAPKTGEVLWQSPGGPAGYGSLIYGVFGGVAQVVGYDRTTLGGWDIKTGKRLWKLEPPNEGDFNVPTPIQVGDQLLVGTENNATRLYAFDCQGRIVAEPIAVNEDLAPDMSTPVVIDDHAYCVWGELYCLDLKNGLRTKWRGEDDAFAIYGTIIGGTDHLLVCGAGGELVLVAADSDRFRVVSRLRPFEQSNPDFYSHPALVGKRLYMRGEHALMCLEL